METQSQIAELCGKKPVIVTGDITKPEDINNLFETAVKEHGPVYALFNNTGGPPPGTFDKFTDEDWQKAYELTLLGYIRTIRAVIPIMRSNGGGRIVNNTSSSTKRVLDNLILSNAFRMGILGMSKTIARELGPDNILVNVISPGKIDTKRVEQIDTAIAQRQGISPDEVRKISFDTIPLKRYGRTEELGKLAVFLCSEANSYISGQNILVDGALVMAY